MKEKLLIHFTIFVLCLAGIFAKVIDMPADNIIWWRALFGASAGFIYLFIIGKWKVPQRKLKWLLISGFLMGMHWWWFFESIQISSLAIGMLSIFTYPIFTVLLEPLIMKTKIKVRQLIGGMGIMGGMFFIVPEFSMSNTTTIGVLMGVSSAIVLAVRNLLINKKLQEIPTLTIMAYHILSTLLIISIPVFALSSGSFRGISLLESFYFLILGVALTLGSHGLLVYCIKLKSASTMGILSSLQVVYATLISVVFFHERPDFSFYVGATIIVAVVIYEMLSIEKESKIMIDEL